MDIIETIKILKNPNTNLSEVTLLFIQEELNSLLKDVAKVHLLSAEQAFISAKISNDRTTEIRVGIGHLRDAFHSYQVYLDKGNFRKGMLWWAFIDNEEITSIKLKMASIALVISFIYERLGDSNSIIWRNRGHKYAQDYRHNRKNAIKEWENATQTEVKSAWVRITGPDTYLRERYKEELIFIKNFARMINEIN